MHEFLSSNKSENIGFRHLRDKIQKSRAAALRHPVAKDLWQLSGHLNGQLVNRSTGTSVSEKKKNLVRTAPTVLGSSTVVYTC